MAQGLDELIQWLIGEVAYFGDGESTPFTAASFCCRAKFTERRTLSQCSESIQFDVMRLCCDCVGGSHAAQTV